MDDCTPPTSNAPLQQVYTAFNALVCYCELPGARFRQLFESNSSTFTYILGDAETKEVYTTQKRLLSKAVVGWVERKER